MTEKILNLQNEGYSIREIAKELGVTKYQVEKVLNENHIAEEEHTFSDQVTHSSQQEAVFNHVNNELKEQLEEYRILLAKKDEQLEDLRWEYQDYSLIQGHNEELASEIDALEQKYAEGCAQVGNLQHTIKQMKSENNFYFIENREQWHSLNDKDKEMALLKDEHTKSLDLIDDQKGEAYGYLLSETLTKIASFEEDENVSLTTLDLLISMINVCVVQYDSLELDDHVFNNPIEMLEDLLELLESRRKELDSSFFSSVIPLELSPSLRSEISQFIAER